MDAFDCDSHEKCKTDQIAQVEAACLDKGLKFTESRRRVLDVLIEEHRAIGAYDILARLATEGRKVQPPIVYRALDFLVTNGFAHKIEHLNAFIACQTPGRRHQPGFKICRKCTRVDEIDGVPVVTHSDGFVAERSVFEVEGVCAHCNDENGTRT